MTQEPDLSRPLSSRLGAKYDIRERQTFVTQRVIAGYSAPQIALLWNNHVKERGEPERQVTQEAIKRDRQNVLARLTRDHKDTLANYRGLLIERYELVIESLHPLVRKGNLGAIDRYLKTLQQLGDVTGANAPIKLEVENVTSLSKEERERRVLEIIQQAKMRSQDIIDGEVEEVVTDPPYLLDGGSDDSH